MGAGGRVAIIGGGVIGSAIAAFLGERGLARTVTVIERDPTYRQASSALSASSIRQQFSTPINIAISQFAIAFLRRVAGEVGLTEPGYLLLASAGGRAALERNHAVQRAQGADIALVAPGELRRRFPWLATEGVALGALGLSGEGWFDGWGLLQLFRRRARAGGATYIADEAVGFERSGRRLAAVRLASGRQVAADLFVNAAGPWAGHVASLAGIALPVCGRRRSVFVVDCRERPDGMPLVVDSSGAWFRPEGPRTICGISPAQDEDPDDAPLAVEHGLFEERVWPALARRVPAFAAVKCVGSWAGYYDWNRFDQNGIVGPHPDLDNLLLANGFSGHGMQQAPAVGRGVAEWIAAGRYETLDLSPLGYDRILRGEPLREENVI